MSVLLRRPRLVLAVLGLFAFVAVDGCSGSFSLAVPGPTSTTQTQTGVTPLPGGLNPGNTQGQTSSTATVTVTSQNPILRTLALLNSFASVTIGGCAAPNSMLVPDVTSIPLGQAQSTLLLAGLTPGNVRWAYSGSVASGTVISQDPAAGTFASPSVAINLLASLGPQPAVVPDVVGKMQAEARAAITGAGFLVGEIAQSFNLTVAAGNIISQDPTAGTLALPGAAVKLLVSQGPQPVAVPNVLGMTQADAQAAIVAAGLSVGPVAQGSSETVPAGSVMSQNPAADAMRLPGTAVDLTVSQGPQPVAVPDVIGRTQTDAQAIITGAGFAIGELTQAWSAAVPTSCVIGQEPVAGTVMIPGTAVNVVVSQGPQPVAVPDVSGKTQAEAQAAITGAGLTVGAITQEYSDAVPEGAVVGQNPAAGSLLTPGNPVNLVLAIKTISLCDYYPLAVGNSWTTAGTSGNNGITSEILEAFVINGCPCFKVKATDHAANDKIAYSYFANAGGWMYGYQVLDDLFLLPGIASSAQKIAPQTVTPGVPFVTKFGGTALSVTPVKGRLSDFVNDTSACPYGDVEDAVALKLGDFVLLVLGRDLGPLYYNYLTKSGFYSSITIVGGCGLN